MRADVVRELNGFDTSFRRHQDYEFWCVILEVQFDCNTRHFTGQE